MLVLTCEARTHVSTPPTPQPDLLLRFHNSVFFFSHDRLDFLYLIACSRAKLFDWASHRAEELRNIHSPLGGLAAKVGVRPPSEMNYGPDTQKAMAGTKRTQLSNLSKQHAPGRRKWDGEGAASLPKEAFSVPEHVTKYRVDATVKCAVSPSTSRHGVEAGWRHGRHDNDKKKTLYHARERCISC